MQLHELSPGKGATKNRKRVGRGRASGHGKTSGRGQKGQLSRSGGGKGSRFEGGQTPLARRVPKLPGFKNRFRIVYDIVNVGRLEKFEDGTEVTPVALAEAGIISKPTARVKVLGGGDIKLKLSVKAHKFAATAREKIEKAGGSVEVIE